jgi:hypothetical protein
MLSPPNNFGYHIVMPSANVEPVTVDLADSFGHHPVNQFYEADGHCLDSLADHLASDSTNERIGNVDADVVYLSIDNHPAVPPILPFGVIESAPGVRTWRNQFCARWKDRATPRRLLGAP